MNPLPLLFSYLSTLSISTGFLPPTHNYSHAVTANLRDSEHRRTEQKDSLCPILAYQCWTIYSTWHLFTSIQFLIGDKCSLPHAFKQCFPMNTFVLFLPAPPDGHPLISGPSIRGMVADLFVLSLCDIRHATSLCFSFQPPCLFWESTIPLSQISSPCSSQFNSAFTKFNR